VLCFVILFSVCICSDCVMLACVVGLRYLGLVPKGCVRINRVLLDYVVRFSFDSVLLHCVFTFCCDCVLFLFCVLPHFILLVCALFLLYSVTVFC
jgi:hypothetical protein